MFTCMFAGLLQPTDTVKQVIFVREKFSPNLSLSLGGKNLPVEILPELNI